MAGKGCSQVGNINIQLKVMDSEDIMLNQPKSWGTYLKRPYFE